MTASDRDHASLRFGWTLLFVGALAGTALELAHAFKLAAYLDDPLTRLLLTLAHAHAVGLALVVLAHAHVGPDPRPSTGRLLRLGALLLPLGFALGAIAHPESDPSIGIVVMETIQGGGGIVEAPERFWRELRALCDKHGVLWVADEVQCGLGRTGQFFAFERDGVVPDVTALAKALGGSKAAMGAMIARREIYMKAYGKPKSALIHAQATFGGMGEACVSSIEALNVLYDEDLMGNAQRQGDYLIEKLNGLRAKYPTLLKEIRGRGLMIGVELKGRVTPALRGLQGRGVLVLPAGATTFRLLPPMIWEQVQVDEFLSVASEVLA